MTELLCWSEPTDRWIGCQFGDMTGERIENRQIDNCWPNSDLSVHELYYRGGAMFRACLVLIILTARFCYAQPSAVTDSTRQLVPEDPAQSINQENARLLIRLKGSFFGDLKYSVDTASFSRVSWTGKELYPYLTEKDARSALAVYRHKKLASICFRYVTALIICASGVLAMEDEPNDGKDLALYGGIPVVTIAMILNGSANRHLKNAVRLHNSAIASESSALTIRIGPSVHKGRVGLAMNLRF